VDIVMVWRKEVEREKRQERGEGRRERIGGTDLRTRSDDFDGPSVDTTKWSVCPSLLLPSLPPSSPSTLSQVLNMNLGA
jgi:hypothetical protein